MTEEFLKRVEPLTVLATPTTRMRSANGCMRWKTKNALTSIPRIGESHQLGAQQGKGKTEVHGA